MTDEQVIRLVLELAGQEKADQLAKALGQAGDAGKDAARGVQSLESATYELADVYEVLTTDLSDADRALDRLTAEAVEATRTQRLLAAAIDDVGRQAAEATTGVDRLGSAKTKMAKSSGSAGQSFLNFGRIVQDFSQGGIPGILNNIEGMTASLGLGAGLAGVLTVAGVAAFVFKDRIADLAEAAGLLQVTFGTEGLLGTLGKVESALKTNAKELDALKDKQRLTADEIARYNELSRQQIDLEKRKADEMERQSRAKALAGLERPSDAQANKDRADQLKADVGGEQESLVTGVLGATPRAKLDALTKEVDQRAALERKLLVRYKEGEVHLSQAIELNHRLMDRARAAIDQEEVARRATATDIVARAVTGGDQEAINKVRDAINLNPTAFTGRQRGAFEALADGGKTRKDAEAERKSQAAAADEVRKASEQDAARIKADAVKAAAVAMKVQADQARQDKADAKDQAARDKAAFQATTDRAKIARDVQDDVTANVRDRTGFDEAALVYAARVRAAGGGIDPRTGRRTGRDPFVAASGDLSNQIARTNPGLSPDQARGAGVEIAGQAFGQVDEIIEATRQGLAASGQGLSAAQINQQAIAATLQAVQLARGKADQALAVANQLLGLAQEEVRRNAPRRSGLLRRGFR